MLDGCGLYVVNIIIDLLMLPVVHHACNLNWNEMAFRFSYVRGHRVERV